MKRITDLSTPPVVGTYYLVPTVRYIYRGLTKRDWPVLPPLHEDARFFDFKHKHFHIDGRFLTAQTFDRLNDWGRGSWETLQAVPLAYLGDRRSLIPHPQIVWRRRRCARSVIPYQFGHMREVRAIADAYADVKCRHVRTGWVCPHQRFPLGSIGAIDGVITCPLHGLRIDAETGQVLKAA